MALSSILDRRLGRLERQEAKRRNEMNTWQWYSFLVAPTCPPSTSIAIRPGLALPAIRYGLVQQDTYTGPQTCDFTDTATTGYAANFTNAGYYVGFILCYNSVWMLNNAASSQVFTLIGAAAEYATSAEAEEEIRLLLNGGDDWIYAVFPLWAVVLKNNGTTGTDGAVLPVDAVNRGRSYLFKDARQRNLLTK